MRIVPTALTLCGLAGLILTTGGAARDSMACSDTLIHGTFGTTYPANSSGSYQWFTRNNGTASFTMTTPTSTLSGPLSNSSWTGGLHTLGVDDMVDGETNFDTGSPGTGWVKLTMPTTSCAASWTDSVLITVQ